MSNTPSDPGSPPGTPRWVKVFMIVFIVLVVLFVILHLLGFGFRGHDPISLDGSLLSMLQALQVL